MQICTRLWWRNAMFWKRRFRIVWSDSLNLPVLSLLCAWARHLKTRTQRSQAICTSVLPASKLQLIKKSIILTPCTSIQRKLENEQRKNYRILISSCWNTEIRLSDFYSKRGFGPDQSHYKQSWAQFCCKMWGDSCVWNRRSDVSCIPIPNLIYRGVLRATLITLCPCKWCTYWYN